MVIDAGPGGEGGVGGGHVSISDVTLSICGAAFALQTSSPAKLSLRQISHGHIGHSALLGASDWEIIAPMCFFFFFFGYPIANPTKHLAMMDSGETWGATAAYTVDTLACLLDDISHSVHGPKR